MDRSLEPSAHRRLHGDDTGVALVEFALLVPFLAILVFGTVDVGRGFQAKNRLTNMAREGAFYGQFAANQVSGCSGEDIVDRALAEDPAQAATVVVTARGTNGDTRPLTGCGTATVTPGETLRVVVSTELQILTPLVGAVTGPKVTVEGSAEVVVQG